MGCRLARPDEFKEEELPPCKYCKRISLFLGYSLCQVCIGATTMMAFAYSVRMSDYHVAFCTIGWQFLMAEGVLSMVYTWSNPIRFNHRRITHMFLQILGLMFIVAGSVLIVFMSLSLKKPFHVHGIIGIAALLMTMVTALAGPIAALKFTSTKILHAVLGIPTFVLGSVAFVTGTLTERFLIFYGLPIFSFLIALCSYYTIFIFINIIFKIVERIKNKQHVQPGIMSNITGSPNIRGQI